MSQKISIVFGTRPEAIKLAPVILELKKHEFDINICVTAQHREMLDQVLNVFEITPDVDLNLMKPDQNLASLTSDSIKLLNSYFSDYKPDLLFVQGDTTTVLAASLTAFYNKIKIAHVEAGLRTHNKYAPFPEEINRVLTSRLADYHFAPTAWSKNNLLSEGVEESKIHVTGNTVIDALFIALKKVTDDIIIPGLQNDSLKSFGDRKVVLITGHRRENFGSGFESICMAIGKLADKFPDVDFVYPVHLNPNVQEPVKRILGTGKKSNIFLIKPLDYLPFIALMKRAYIILTDSGGIQEEAPSLAKPLLVMRELTERPEGLNSGAVKLVGTHEKIIISEVSKLLENIDYYNSTSPKFNPYGDGNAAQKIVELLIGGV